MLKTQTKKIKNRKVSKIIAGILSLLMFATSNGSFLVWGLSEGQLNFLGEPAVAQAKTAEAKVIETADAITVDEIMQESQPKSHWWEFWKKEKTENQQTASGFSDLKTELVAREVLGDKTVDALSDDLKTGKNDLTSKESKNKISFFKKLWANFEGAFNGSLTTRISILERLGGNNSNYGNDEISNMGKKIYQIKLDKSEKKQLEQEARKRAEQVVRQKARKEYEQYKESVLFDNREPVGFEQYFQENWGDDAIDYQAEEEYRTLRNDKINSRRAEKMAEYANKTLLPNIKETLKKEIESSWYLTKLVREFNGNKQEALKERNRRLEKLNQTQFDDPYKYGFRFGGARRRNMMAFYDPITDKIYINADANWMSNNATRLDQVSGKFESDMVAHEVMHAITMKMSSDKSRAELVNEDTELKVGDMVKPYSRDMNLSFEMYDYLTTPAEFIVRQKFATYDLEKYCGKKITADVTTDQINCLRKIEEESPEKLHPHTLEFLRITKLDKIKESINTIADTKQYATGNQDGLYAETRPYNPKTDGDIVDPITGEKVQTAKKKEGWLAGLIGKVFGPKESVAGDGDNTKLFVDGNGDVRDENGLYKGEIWEKYSKEARKKIQSDPSNTSQQSAKLKVIEEKNGWLAKIGSVINPLNWFGRKEDFDGQRAQDDGNYGDSSVDNDSVAFDRLGENGIDGNKKKVNLVIVDSGFDCDTFKEVSHFDTCPTIKGYFDGVNKQYYDHPNNTVLEDRDKDRSHGSIMVAAAFAGLSPDRLKDVNLYIVSDTDSQGVIDRDALNNGLDWVNQKLVDDKSQTVVNVSQDTFQTNTSEVENDLLNTDSLKKIANRNNVVVFQAVGNYGADYLGDRFMEGKKSRDVITVGAFNIENGSVLNEKTSGGKNSYQVEEYAPNVFHFSVNGKSIGNGGTSSASAYNAAYTAWQFASGDIKDENGDGKINVEDVKINHATLPGNSLVLSSAASSLRILKAFNAKYDKDRDVFVVKEKDGTVIEEPSSKYNLINYTPDEIDAIYKKIEEPKKIGIAKKKDIALFKQNKIKDGDYTPIGMTPAYEVFSLGRNLSTMGYEWDENAEAWIKKGKNGNIAIPLGSAYVALAKNDWQNLVSVQAPNKKDSTLDLQNIKKINDQIFANNPIVDKNNPDTWFVDDWQETMLKQSPEILHNVRNQDFVNKVSLLENMNVEERLKKVDSSIKDVKVIYGADGTMEGALASSDNSNLKILNPHNGKEIASMHQIAKNEYEIYKNGQKLGNVEANSREELLWKVGMDKSEKRLNASGKRDSNIDARSLKTIEEKKGWLAKVGSVINLFSWFGGNKNKQSTEQEAKDYFGTEEETIAGLGGDSRDSIIAGENNNTVPYNGIGGYIEGSTKVPFDVNKIKVYNDEKKNIIKHVIARNPYIREDDMAKDPALHDLPSVYKTIAEPYIKAIKSGFADKSRIDRMLDDVAEQATIVTRNLYFQKKPITEKNVFDELRNIHVVQNEVENLPLFSDRKVFVLANNEKIDSEFAKKYATPDSKIGTNEFAPDKLIYNIQRQTVQPVTFQLARGKKDLDEKEVKTFLEEFSSSKEPSTFLFNGHGGSDKLYYTNNTTLSVEDLFNAYQKRWENRQSPTKLSDRDIIILTSCHSSNFLRNFMELCEKNKVPKPIVTSESEYGQYGAGELFTSQYNNRFFDIIDDKKTTLGSVIKINKTNPDGNPIIYIPDEKENTRQVTDIKQYAIGNQDELYADDSNNSNKYVNPITGEVIENPESIIAQQKLVKKELENSKGLFAKAGEKISNFFARDSVADPTDDSKIQKENNPETGEVVYYEGGIKLMTADKYAKYTKGESNNARQKIQSDPSNTSQQSAKLKAIEEKNGWLAKVGSVINPFSWFGGEKKSDERVAALDSFYTAGENDGKNNNTAYNDIAKKYIQPDMKDGYGDEIAGLDGSRSESNNQLNDNQQKVASEENQRETDLMNSIERSTEYNDPSQIQTTGGTIRSMSRNQILRELNRVNNQINNIHGIKVDSNGNDSRNKLRNLLQYRKKLQESLNSGLVGENGNNGNQIPIITSAGDGYDENGNLRPTGLAGSTFNISQKEKKSWLASGWEEFTSWFGGNKDKQITEQEADDYFGTGGETIAGLGENDKGNSSYDDLVAKYGKDDMKDGYGDEIAGVKEQVDKNNSFVTDANGDKILGAANNDSGFWGSLFKGGGKNKQVIKQEVSNKAQKNAEFIDSEWEPSVKNQAMRGMNENGITFFSGENSTEDSMRQQIAQRVLMGDEDFFIEDIVPKDYDKEHIQEVVNSLPNSAKAKGKYPNIQPLSELQQLFSRALREDLSFYPAYVPSDDPEEDRKRRLIDEKIKEALKLRAEYNERSAEKIAKGVRDDQLIRLKKVIEEKKEEGTDVRTIEKLYQKASKNEDLGIDSDKKILKSSNVGILDDKTNPTQQAAKLKSIEENKGWLASGWEKITGTLAGLFKKDEKPTEENFDALDSFYTAGDETGDENNDTAYNKAVSKYERDDNTGFSDEKLADLDKQAKNMGDNSFVTDADGNKVLFTNEQKIMVDADQTLVDKTLMNGKDFTVYSTEDDIRDISSENRDLLKDKYPIDKFNYVRLPGSRNNALIVEDKNGQPVAMANGRQLFEKDSKHLPFNEKMLEAAKKKYGYVESKDRANLPQVVTVDKSSSQDVKSNKNDNFSEQKEWLKNNYSSQNDGSVKYTKMRSGAVIVTKSGVPEAVLFQEDETGHMLKDPILRRDDPETVDRLFTKAIESGGYKLPSVLPSGRKKVVSSVKYKDNEVTHWEQQGNYLIGRNSKNVAILSQPLTKIPTKESGIMDKATTLAMFTGGPGVAIKLTSRLFGDHILHMFGSSKYKQVKSAYPIVTYSAPDDKKEYEPIRSLLQQAAQVNDNGGRVVSSQMLTNDGKSFKTQEEVLQSSQFKGKKQEKSPSGNVLVYGDNKQPIAYVKENGEVIYSKVGEKFAQGDTKYSFFRTEKNGSSIVQILSDIGDSIIKPAKDVAESAGAKINSMLKFGSDILQNNKSNGYSSNKAPIKIPNKKEVAAIKASMENDAGKNLSKKVGNYAVKEVEVRAKNGSQQTIKVVVNNNEVLGVLDKTGEIIQMKNIVGKVRNMTEGEMNAFIKTLGVTAVVGNIGLPGLVVAGAYGLFQLPPEERTKTLDNLSKQAGNAGQQLVETLNSATEDINQTATKAQKVVNETIDAGQKSYNTYIPGRPEDVLPFSNEDYPKGKIYLDKEKSYSVSQDTNGKKTYEQCGTLGSTFSFFSGCKSGAELAKNSNDISTEKAPAWINPDTGGAYRDTNLKRAPVELSDSKKNPVDTTVQGNQGVNSSVNEGSDIKIEKNNESKDKVANKDAKNTLIIKRYGQTEVGTIVYLPPDEKGVVKILDDGRVSYEKCGKVESWFSFMNSCESASDLAGRYKNIKLMGVGTRESDTKNDITKDDAVARNGAVINKDSAVTSGTDASLVRVEPGKTKLRMEGDELYNTPSEKGDIGETDSKIKIKPLREESFWSRFNPLNRFGGKEKDAYEQAGEEFGAQYQVGTGSASSKDKQEEPVKVGEINVNVIVEGQGEGNVKYVRADEYKENGGAWDKFKEDLSNSWVGGLFGNKKNDNTENAFELDEVESDDRSSSSEDWSDDGVAGDTIKVGSEPHDNIGVSNEGNYSGDDWGEDLGDTVNDKQTISDGGVSDNDAQETQSDQVGVQSQAQPQVASNFNLDKFLDSGLVNGLARGSKEVLGMLSNGTLTADQGTRILAENVIQSTGQEAARQLFGDVGNDGEKHLTSLQSGLADLATGVISAVSLGDTDRLVESAGGLALNAAWDTLAENNLISTDVHDSLNGYIGNAMEHTAATLVSTGDIGETVKVFATDVSSGYLTEVINNNASLWGEGNMPIGQTGVVTTGLASAGSSLIGQLINNGSIDLEKTAIDVGQGIITTELTNLAVEQFLASTAVQTTINTASQTAITSTLNSLQSVASNLAPDTALRLANSAGTQAATQATSQAASQAATAVVPFVSMLMSIGMDLVKTGTVHAETIGIGVTSAAGATVGAEIGSVIPGIGNVVGGVIGGALGAIAGAFGIGTGGPSERMLKEWQRTTEEAVAPNLLNNNIASSDMRRINRALANNDIGAVDRIVNESLRNTPLGQIAGIAGLEGVFDIAERMVQNEFTRAMNVRSLPGVLEANTIDYLPGNNVVNDYIHLSNKLSDCYRRHDQNCVTDVSKQLHKAKGTVMSYVTNNFNDKIREIDREILKLQEELNRVTDQKRRLELQSRVSSLSSQRRVINNAREQFIKSQAHSCGGGTSWDFNASACISDQQACLNRGGYIWRGGRCVLNNTAKKEAECLKKGAGWDWTGYSCEWDDPEGGDGDSD